MNDYKQMYMELLVASEKAINILIEAQQKCGDIYISSESENKKVEE